MTHATKSFHNRIALIFDFNKTLAPDTYSILLASCDIDTERFRQESVE